MATGDSTHPGDGAAADRPETVTELTDGHTGRWQVTTETSIYLLDLDRRTMLRVPGAGIGVQRDPTRGHIPVTALPADHRVVRLQQLLRCEVGLSMYLLTEPWPDGTVMVRGTTPVRDIRSLDTHAPDAPRERS
jgi:hypothetical protein